MGHIFKVLPLVCFFAVVSTSNTGDKVKRAILAGSSINGYGYPRQIPYPSVDVFEKIPIIKQIDGYQYPVPTNQLKIYKPPREYLPPITTRKPTTRLNREYLPPRTTPATTTTKRRPLTTTTTTRRPTTTTTRRPPTTTRRTPPPTIRINTYPTTSREYLPPRKPTTTQRPRTIPNTYLPPVVRTTTRRPITTTRRPTTTTRKPITTTTTRRPITTTRRPTTTTRRITTTKTHLIPDQSIIVKKGYEYPVPKIPFIF